MGEMIKKHNGCEIWAFGGGKGGCGKSFVTSNVGVFLATTGKRVVLVDADLGGANLHSFLGVKKPANTLDDFFQKGMSLNEITTRCGNGKSEVGLIMGDTHSLESDNVKYTQKLKLFRQIKALETDHVLIDLGAGSHFSTMDTFLLADRRVVVIIPEITSIENMYQFVKSALFRRLSMAFGECGMKYVFQNTWNNRVEYGIKNIKGLVDYLGKISSEARELIDMEIHSFGIDLILNQTRYAEDIEIAMNVKSIFKKYLGLNVNYLGNIEYDDAAWISVRKRETVIHSNPASPSASEIKNLTKKLMQCEQAAW